MACLSCHPAHVISQSIVIVRWTRLCDGGSFVGLSCIGGPPHVNRPGLLRLFSWTLGKGSLDNVIEVKPLDYVPERDVPMACLKVTLVQEHVGNRGSKFALDPILDGLGKLLDHRGQHDQVSATFPCNCRRVQELSNNLGPTDLIYRYVLEILAFAKHQPTITARQDVNVSL